MKKNTCVPGSVGKTGGQKQTTTMASADAADFAQFVSSVVAHPLVVIRFHLDHDLSMVFHAVENEQGTLTGVGLTPVRRSQGAHFVRLHPHLLTQVFAPVVAPLGSSGRDWSLQIQPLPEELRLQKRPNGKYVCFYPFKAQGRQGTLQEIWVDGQRPPQLQLWFNIHATYQAAKDAPKQRLQCRIDCPEAFTQRLFHLTQPSPAPS